jgi:predicted nucleotidyltransferase
MTLPERVAAKREEIVLVAARHGARDIRLFGSVARGEAGPDSDVDFLVEMEQGRSLLDRINLRLELERLLGCRVDVVSEKALRTRILGRVLAEAVPL